MAAKDCRGASGVIGRMKTKTILFFLLALTALRCGWIALQDISPREAYYWLCSERLAPAFFDGPPGVALLIRVFNELGGKGLQLARMVWPILGFGVAGVVWLLARRMYDEAVAGWVVITLNVLPVFNNETTNIGSMMPAFFFIMAGFLAIRLVWEGRQYFWLIAALSFAFATLFRYEAVLLPFGICVAMLTTSRHRSRREWLGLALVVFLIGLALWRPLAWNASLEWVPIAGGTLKAARSFHLDQFLTELKLFLFNFSLIGPALLAGLIWIFREAKLHGRARFLLAMCAPAWLWWLYSSLRGENAMFAAFIGCVPLVMFLFSECRKFQRGALCASLFGVVALISSGLSLWKNCRDSLVWPLLAREVRSTAHEVSSNDLFFIAEDQDLAAVLGFYMNMERQENYPSVFVPESPDFSSQFAIWPSYADFIESDQIVDEYFTEQRGINPFMGRSALYVGFDLPQTIKGAFAEVIPIRRVDINGIHASTIYLCRNYRTLPL